MKRYVAIVLMLVAICMAGLRAEARMAADSAAVPAIVERINASGHISVRMPAALAARLCDEAGMSVGEAVEQEERQPSANARVGYRIQVYDDNDPRTARSEAQNRKRLVETRFPEWRSYIEFNSPYWRVKVGDFRTRSMAEGAIEEIRQAFPYMSAQLRIVRDRINTTD